VCVGLRGLIIGGYGGHAAYAFAVCRELARRGAELEILLPRGYSHLARKFEGLGKLAFATLPRKPLEPLWRGAPRWLLNFLESLKLAGGDFDFVFASGSNFSLLPSIIARFLGRARLYTLEDLNRFYSRSKAVSLLARAGATVFLQWEEQKSLYPSGLVAGPVFEPQIYRTEDRGYVLVTTGTLGDRELIEALIELEVGEAVIQAGDLNMSEYKRKRPEWVFFNYTEDMHWWIAGASVVVTHPGTTAATARLAYGKPVVIAYTRRHSRLYDKREVALLAKKLGAALLERPQADALLRSIEVAKRAERAAYPSGAAKIANTILGG